MYYEKELRAIKKSNRYREKKLFDTSLIDLASNDYLGFAHHKALAQKAFLKLQEHSSHGPKASILVNGYHPIHQDFELRLKEHNGFEDALVVGSGFLANIALIEALVRKRDALFIDEKYHASGNLASALVQGEVQTFNHNNAQVLEAFLKQSAAQRNIVAVEGVYSMDGDILNPDIITVCDKYDAILIIDEAHSSGVLGSKLCGVYDAFDISIKPNHIKMGTLGKAYGSYGAYILASAHIIEFLQNRAKSVIYTTAPSLFDIALADESLCYLQENTQTLKTQISTRMDLVKEIFNKKLDSLIFVHKMPTSADALRLQEKLLQDNITVGAIRPPTVETPIMRVILRLGVEEAIIKTCLETIKQYA